MNRAMYLVKMFEGYSDLEVYLNEMQEYDPILMSETNRCIVVVMKWNSYPAHQSAPPEAE